MARYQEAGTDPETGAFQPAGPQSGGVLEGLQAIGEQGQNAQPSPQGAASQGGALGAPPSGGDGSTAFGPRAEPEEKGMTGRRYLDMWNESSAEDKKHQLDSLEEQLGGAGTGVKAKANEFIGQAMKSGNEAILHLAGEFGWAPRSGQPGQGEALKGGDQALEDQEAAFADPKGTKKKQRAELVDAKRKRGEWTREDMGGFLTELGFRILASNKESAGGALGESVGGMRDEKKEQKRYDESQSIAKAAAARKTSREDRSDTIMENKEQRDVAKSQREGVEKITKSDGTVEYVNIKEGTVKDKEGNVLRVPTDADTSKAQQLTNARGIANAYKSAKTRYNKVASDRTDTEVKRIEKIKDPKEKAAAKQKWIEDEVESERHPGYVRPDIDTVEDW